MQTLLCWPLDSNKAIEMDSSQTDSECAKVTASEWKLRGCFCLQYRQANCNELSWDLADP